MREVSYMVFTELGVAVVKGLDIALPPVFEGYPVIKMVDGCVEVRLFNLVQRPDIQDTMKQCLRPLIEAMREIGVPRLEFPNWDVMIAYSVERSAADAEYWDFEQLINSFFAQYGPEFIM